MQVARSVAEIEKKNGQPIGGQQMLVTGGGALNDYLVSRIRLHLNPMELAVEIPDAVTVNYKEALIMALLGVLRWREEDTVMAEVTGASRSSIGGALWMGSH
jgi:anhydro-N-acetylmuramic acid kinase